MHDHVVLDLHLTVVMKSYCDTKYQGAAGYTT